MTKKLSAESWKDIYTVYYETISQPTLMVREGIMPVAHLMLNYVEPEDALPNEEE